MPAMKRIALGLLAALILAAPALAAAWAICRPRQPWRVTGTSVAPGTVIVEQLTPSTYLVRSQEQPR